MLDWLKVIPFVFREMIKGLRELQEMAGGYKRGQVVFWALFLVGSSILLVILAIAIEPAYSSLASVLSHFNINLYQVNVDIPSSIFLNLGLSLFMALISMIVLIGIALALGILLGVIADLILAPYTTGRIDELFSELLPLLNELNETNSTETTERLVTDCTALYTRWNKNYMTKIAGRWWRFSKKTKKESKNNT